MVVSEVDDRPPWIRAGGFPEADWRKVLDFVVRKTRDALVAEGEYRLEAPGKPGEWLRELDRLRANVERWRELRTGVLRGDPKLFGEAETAWMRETGQLK